MNTELGFSDSNCPLCGEPNQCAMNAGNGVGDCWCKDVEIDPDALQAIPAQMQRKVCICKACAPSGETTP